MSYFYKKKNKKNKKIFSWVAIVILFIICLFLIKNVFNIYQSEKKSRLTKVQSEYILNELDERNKQVSLEIEYLKTEKGVETELRDKFRVVKEGEQMAVIINSEDKDKKMEISEDNSIWRKIKSFLKLD